MGKLEDLKTLVGNMFKDATEKQDIDNLAQINNAIDEVSKEQDQLVAKNAELITSYKELVKHTSFNDDKKVLQNENNTQEVKPVKSLEDALEEFIANKK